MNASLVSVRLRRAVWPLVAMVVVGLLFLAVFPTRTWLAQRRDRVAVVQRVAVLTAQNDTLERRARKLHDDAEIERLAREQYNLVKPGEEAYAILPPPLPAEPPAAQHRHRAPHRGLLSRAWHVLTFWS